MAKKSNVELLISAKDLSAQPFGAVTAALAGLTDKLARQSEAAQRGQATTRELAATLRELDAAGTALIKQSNLVDLYKRLAEQTEKAGEKASGARAEFDRFKASLSGDATAAEQRRLEALGRTADRLDGQLAKARARMDSRGDDLRSMGLDPGDLAKAEAQLGAVAAEQAELRARAQQSLDQYDENLRKHRAAVAETAAAEKAAADQSAKNAQNYVNFWTRALDEVDAARKESAAELARLMAIEEAESRETARIEARVKAEKDEIAAFHAKADAARKLREAAEYVRFWETELDKATEAEKRNAAATTAAAKASQDAAARFRVAQGQQAAASGQQKAAKPGGFLGLQPYELQNLGYQVNDIVTQLGSGASLTQTLAQQGGQIFQIFQKQLGSFVEFLPRLIAAGAVLGVAVALFARMSANAAATRQFTAELKLSADGANYQADALVKLQRQLERVTGDFEQAGKGLKVFMQAGVRQDQMALLGTSVANIARVLGMDFPAAAKLAADALTKGDEAIKTMNESFNVLSQKQLEQINQAIRSGDVEKARIIVFQALADKGKNLAQVLESDLTKALKDARNAFNDMLDLLANGALGRLALSVVSGLGAGIQAVVNGVRAIVDMLPGGGGVENDPRLVEQALQKAQDKLKALQAQTPPLMPGLGGARLGPNGGQGMPENPALTNWQTFQTKQIADAKAAVDGLKARLDLLNDTKGKEAAATQAATEATARQLAGDKEYLQNLADQINLHKGLNNGLRIEAAGRQAYKDAINAGRSATAAATAQARVEVEERRKIGEEMRSQAEALESELNSLVASAGKSQKESLAARLQAIDTQYAIIFKKIDDYARHGGGSLNGMSMPDLRAQVEAAKDFLKVQETQKYYDENINQLVQARQQKFADLLEDVKDGRKTSAEAFQDAQTYNSRIGPQLEKLTEQALEWAKALYAVKPSPQLEAFINRSERTRGNATGTGRTAPVGQFATQSADAGLSKVNEIVQRRNDLEQAYQNLANKGVITQREASAGIARAFQETGSALEEATAQLEKMIEAMERAGASASQIDLLRAKLAEVRAEAKYVDPEMKKLRTTIEDSFANRAVEAVDSVAQSIGAAVAGTKSWGDAFAESGVAAARFFAQLLQDIAKEILMEQAKAAIKSAIKAIGLFHAGGVVGGAVGGGQSRMVSSAAFVGAPRYHDGTIVGLGSDEQAAILQRGEEVLTAKDPRNIMNIAKQGGQGSQGGGVRNIRNVLVLKDDEIASAMQSADGEAVTLTHIRRNSAAIRNMLKG